MAKYIIFNGTNNLVKIAESDAVKDSIIAYGETAVTCTDTQFTDVQKGKKTASYSNNTLSLNDANAEFYIGTGDTEIAEMATANVEIIKENINNYISKVEGWLENNTDSNWTSYLTALKAIDQDNITAPTTAITFEEWLLSQPNFPQKTILQLS